MINHIVLLQFKPQLTTTEIQQILAKLANLQAAIPEILAFSSGANISNEALNKGFTHGFIMQFADTASRDHYLEHPEHKKVAQEFVLPALVNNLESALAFDYASNEL